MSDPVVIIGELDDLVKRLDKASRDIYQLQTKFDEVSANYDDAINDLTCTMLEGYDEEDKRPPSDEKLKILVTKKMRQEEPILYGEYRRLRDELKRKQNRARRISDEISGRQSQLSYLKTEASAAG